MHRSLLSRFTGGLTLCVSLLVSGCEDGPTSPNVFTHPADGEVWAAILVPEGTPDARTWLPYVRDPREPDGPAVEVRRLQAEAERLRRGGDLLGSLEREREAASAAAAAVGSTPPAHLLVTVLGALDLWLERADAALAYGDFGDLFERRDAVVRERNAAREALAAGDTLAAIGRITAGSALIREQAPVSVAALVLARAERRVESLGRTDRDAERAIRLLRYSREALANGDPVRALRRALYALQLAEQITDPGVGSGARLSN